MTHSQVIKCNSKLKRHQNSIQLIIGVAGIHPYIAYDWKWRA